MRPRVEEAAVKSLAIMLSLAIASAAVPACSAATSGHGVPKDVLAADIAQLARDMGGDFESVKCRDDLIGEVGQSTQCEIEASSAKYALTPIVTVTSVGDKVNWEVKPTLTPEQLERQITEVISDGSGAAPNSVSCPSGLEGPEGNTTRCDVAPGGGAPLPRTIEVREAKGLSLVWRMLPMLTREQAEQSLQSHLARDLGYPPDSVACAGELVGKKDNTVECAVVAAPDSWTYLLTVHSVNGDEILYRYEPVA
jgi:hypothetical protein